MADGPDLARASPARNVGPDPAAASHRADAAGLIDSAGSVVRPARIQHDQLKQWRLHGLKETVERSSA